MPEFGKFTDEYRRLLDLIWFNLNTTTKNHQLSPHQSPAHWPFY